MCDWRLSHLTNFWEDWSWSRTPAVKWRGKKFLIEHVVNVKTLNGSEHDGRSFFPFLYARLETGRIMWLGTAGVHTGFRTITLVLYIGSLPNLATWFPCGRGRTIFILGSKVKVTYYKYNFWQQGRFHIITLVLYVGSLPNLVTWLPISCWCLFLVNIYSFLKYLGKNEKLNFKEIFFSFRNWKC